MRRRKYLLVGKGMLICVALIVSIVIFIGLVILRKGYQDESPDYVAYNYLMAIVKQDYERAYGFLSPTLPQYPTEVDIFKNDLEMHDLLPLFELDPCVYIEEMNKSTYYAEVALRVQYYDPCLFGIETTNLSFNRVNIELRKIENEWKIIDSDGCFFLKCWSDESECD